MNEYNEAAINRWLELKKYNQGCSDYTVYKYRLILERFGAWLDAENQHIRNVSPQLLEHYTGMYLHQQGVAPRSRKPIISCLRGFFAWLEKSGLGANAATVLTQPKTGRKLPVPAQLQHAEALLMQCDLSTFIGVRNAAILSVLIGTGCRVSGLCGLNLGDLIFTRSESNTERLIIRFREKGKKERLIPAPLETSLFVRAYLGHEALEGIDATLPMGGTVLFVSTANRNVAAHEYVGEKRRLSCREIDRIIKRYGKMASLPADVCHAHALRHLYGTELAEEEIDLIGRKALLGHERADTTADYTHLALRKLGQMADKANPLRKIKTHVSSLASIVRKDAI